MKPINALHLHHYFCNQYLHRYEREYQYKGKGLELSLLKRLMYDYDPYQIMLVTYVYVDTSIFCSVKDMCSAFPQLIDEYAPDPLAAKGAMALKAKKTPQLLQAYYDYVDETDAWFPSRLRIDEAAMQLDKMAEDVLG